MTDTRAPRPTDLVALVTFDGEVRENQAVTRERLAQPHATPKPLSAAMEQWLHLGRRTWVHVSGREIRGIATARELSARMAWEIDTLIDASPDDAPGTVGELLRQATAAAHESGVTHLLLRTRVDAPALTEALRAGFRRVSDERWWLGRLRPFVDPEAKERPAVRDWTEADIYPCFQIYNHAMPVESRSALAVTLDEWRATRDRRWQERGGALVAEDGSIVVATARYARPSGPFAGQFAIQARPGVDAAADALLRVVAARTREVPLHRALVPAGAVTEEGALQRAGMEPVAAYAFLCRRISKPLHEEARARAGVAITSG